MRIFVVFVMPLSAQILDNLTIVDLAMANALKHF